MSVSLPTLSLSPRLAALFRACETYCLAECCGIDAFDFSPLHIASHLSGTTGSIQQSEVDELEREIRALVSKAQSLPPKQEGELACTIEGTNQYFSATEVARLGNELIRGLHLAPEVLKFAENLRRRSG